MISWEKNWYEVLQKILWLSIMNVSSATENCEEKYILVDIKNIIGLRILEKMLKNFQEFHFIFFS